MGFFKTMIHNFKLDLGPYLSIHSKEKDIEMRLYDENRQIVHKGDYIVFYCLENNESMLCKVVDLHIYKSFDELYSRFPKERLGYKKYEPAHPDDMHKYYSKERIAKYGVVGIEVSLYEKPISIDYLNETIIIDNTEYSYKEAESHL